MKKTEWFRDQIEDSGKTRLCIQGARFIRKKTNFNFLREFAKLHYKSSELTFAEYIQICTICDKADERLLLESEE